MNSDKHILELFLNLLPPHKTTATGWKQFDCPECGDRRNRGSFIETPTGGFRYHCFNGGCTYNENPTGWEPGNYIGGRTKKLYTLLGGRIKNLPLQNLIFKNVAEKPPELDFVKRFDEIDLPENTISILDYSLAQNNKHFLDVVEYLFDRMEPYIQERWFFWSEKMPRCVIVPYLNYGNVVGWFARSIDDGKKFQKCNSNFMFRQDSLDTESRAVLLLEGVFDSIAVKGIGLRGTKINQKQINLLNDSGKDVIVVPDQEKDGSHLITIAKEQDWYITTPDWDLGIKDPVEAVNKYGRLYVIEDLVKNKHKNYLKSMVSVNVNELFKGKKIE